MEGLVKTPARIKKFVPHSGANSPDLKQVRVSRTIPVLKPESFDQLAHDARNVLSALKLYSDLLAEPGILTESHSHYAQELQAVTDIAARLMERLAAPRRTGSRRPSAVSSQESAHGEVRAEATRIEIPAAVYPWQRECADNLGRELLAMRPLLAAIAGPRIELEIESLSCAGRSGLSSEDLTCVLMNLVRNACEAMPEGGKLRITAQYGDGLNFVDAGQAPDARPRSVVITVEDSGPGIPEDLREQVFTAGFTMRQSARKWPGTQHRGHGLSIVRGLIEAAGGTARISTSSRGARFELELPITSGMYETTDNRRLVADLDAKGCIECP